MLINKVYETLFCQNKQTSSLPDEKFNPKWLAKVVEVVNKYQPDLVYFDNKKDIIEEQTCIKFLSYYYN